MKNRAVIFYGASRNASDHIAEWIEKTGMPDCFADSDIFKQGAKFPVPRTEISGWGGGGYTFSPRSDRQISGFRALRDP